MTTTLGAATDIAGLRVRWGSLSTKRPWWTGADCHTLRLASYDEKG